MCGPAVWKTVGRHVLLILSMVRVVGLLSVRAIVILEATPVLAPRSTMGLVRLMVAVSSWAADAPLPAVSISVVIWLRVTLVTVLGVSCRTIWLLTITFLLCFTPCDSEEASRFRWVVVWASVDRAIMVIPLACRLTW